MRSDSAERNREIMLGVVVLPIIALTHFGDPWQNVARGHREPALTLPRCSSERLVLSEQ